MNGSEKRPVHSSLLETRAPIRLAWVAAMVSVVLVGGCVAQTQMPQYSSTKFQMIIAAETVDAAKKVGTGSDLSEKELQKEVERLLSLRPSARVPAKVVLFQVPSSGISHIRSPRKWIDLRKATSEEMKTALEETGVFEEVDFLPDLLLPPGGPADLKTLRIAAARAQADGVLIYSTEAGYEYHPNAFALLYVTILGAWISPGSEAGSTAVSKAALLDVKSGYIYSVLETYGEESVVTPYAFVDTEELEFKARRASVSALADAAADKARQMGAK